MVSCSYPLRGKYKPPSRGRAVSNLCLLFFLPFPLVVPRSVFVLPSGVRSRLCKGCFVSPIKRNYVVFSGKISTLPARAKRLCGRSYFSFKSLRFSKNLHPRGIVFFEKNLFDVWTRHPVSITKANVRREGEIVQGTR